VFLINQLLKSSRKTKKIIVALSDFFCLSLVILWTLLVSGKSIQDISNFLVFDLLFFPLSTVCVFYFMGVYNSMLRYIDFSAIYLLSSSIFIALLINSFVLFSTSVLGMHFFFQSFQNVSAEILLLGIPTVFFFVVGSRLIAYLVFSNKNSGKRVVIYGAGSAGIQLSEALRVSQEFTPVAFLDSDINLQGTFLGGLKVFHPKKLRKLVTRDKVEEVLVAIPSASQSSLRIVLKEIERYSVKVRILPGLAALAQGKVSVSELKEVDTTDLLGRTEVEANQDLINRNIENKVVLVTGAGGSIGSEISRQVVLNRPKKVILIDSSEYALYTIKNEVEQLNSNLVIIPILANVTNKKRLKEVYESFKVNTVYHAAAYKHVPLVEENPFEAVNNNIIGTKVSAEAAIEAEVETFVLISTDKAVRPTNIMGATKRFAELILQSMSGSPKTKLSMVRFGNVIGSSGSAIPLFQQQIQEGGPVTVTHPEVIRYFMSIPEAAELVIQAGAMGEGGDVFVLDMGEPVKIVEVAKRLISLSGKEIIDDQNPNGDIEIKFTGLRPGEKLYEELLIGDNISNTEHKRIYRAKEDYLSNELLEEYLGLIQKAESEGDILSLREVLKESISGFSPQDEIVDLVYLQKNS